MFNRTKTPTENDDDVPPILDLNPAIATLNDKKAAIGEEAALLRAEEFALAQAEGPDDPDENREARLAEILGTTPVPRRPMRSTRRREISQRLRDLAYAREIVTRDIQTETARASALLQQRLKPEYRKRIGALTDALIALDAAARSCREMSTQVADAGYSSGWMSVHFSRILEGGRNGPIGILLNEIKTAGHLKPNDIPKELA
ncbi:hypothetical protein ACFSOZ_25995 [Mesorhizobium newzealandense]|uniref:Uncharacterized protein n=1 Tax=Mesorhizobium newzealandense TaxID=1300302 RepID=A0ABW4UHA3_9HYPH